MATQAGPAPKGIVGSVKALGQAADLAIARFGGAALTKVELQAMSAASRFHGMLRVTFEGPSRWLFDLESSAGASSSVLVPDSGAGRWLLVPAAGGAPPETFNILDDLNSGGGGANQAIKDDLGSGGTVDAKITNP